VPPEILNAGPPFSTEGGRVAWHVRRRIGVVGMLWNRPGDAWLGLSLKPAERAEAFDKLAGEGKILGACVEGVNSTLFFRAEDLPLVEEVRRGGFAPAPRCEFIAPLDSFIWDRKLIKALFGFYFSWEIYTPADKRRYGGYVLPILYGDRFAGRIEAVCERKAKTLAVRNIWYEDGVKQTKKLQSAIDGCLRRFAKFNACDTVRW